jgi:hypothetical protein
MIELLEKYDKSAIVLKQWFLNQMLEKIDDASIPEDFKEFARQQNISNETVGKILDAQPRAAFDVLDNHKMFVEINISSLGDVFFSYCINNINNTTHFNTTHFKTRKEAEKEAVSVALKMLNDML